MPICTKCLQEKPITAFLIEKTGKRAGRVHRQCKACQRQRVLLYHAKNRTKLTVQHRLWWALNREGNNGKARAYRESRREEINYQDRLRYRRRREEILVRQRRYTHANRAARLRRQARKRHLPATFSAVQRQFMLQYWGYACAACGNQEGFEWTLADDHWIPLASPACPGTIVENMVPLCHGFGGCNTSKRHKDPEVWLRERFGARKARAILQNIRAYFALATHEFAPVPELR